MCRPGWAAWPVMKSFVTKVRIATECWQEGTWCCGSRSKWTGSNTNGIWLSFPISPATTIVLKCKTNRKDSSSRKNRELFHILPDSRRMLSAISLHSRKTPNILVFISVGVTSWICSLTFGPNTYATLKQSTMFQQYHLKCYSTWYGMIMLNVRCSPVYVVTNSRYEAR